VHDGDVPPSESAPLSGWWTALLTLASLLEARPHCRSAIQTCLSSLPTPAQCCLLCVECAQLSLPPALDSLYWTYTFFCCAPSCAYRIYYFRLHGPPSPVPEMFWWFAVQRLSQVPRVARDGHLSTGSGWAPFWSPAPFPCWCLLCWPTASLRLENA
jgi:hypothetical protein